MTDSPPDDDARVDWQWSQSTARTIVERAVEANLLQIDEAVSRMNRGAYGLEDLTDDLRTAWSRGTRDFLDMTRVFSGLAPAPEPVAVVSAAIDEGSQTSGPIEFACKAANSMQLVLKHLHQMHEGEITHEKFGSPEMFRFEPSEIPGGGTPTRVVLKLVGLNQYGTDQDRLIEHTVLPVGRYVGFIGGRNGADFDVVALLLLYVGHPQAAVSVSN
jgi:hypothetical protein